MPPPNGPDSAGAVFLRKMAVGLFVGLKIFHTDSFTFHIKLLYGFCDDAPGTIPLFSVVSFHRQGHAMALLNH
jgi:hypothetical protein